MSVFLVTLAVVVLSALGIGIGLFLKRGPLEKRCSSAPDEVCHCRGEHHGSGPNSGTGCGKKETKA